MKLLQKKERLLSLLLALSAVAALKADDEFDNPGWDLRSYVAPLKDAIRRGSENALAEYDAENGYIRNKSASYASPSNDASSVSNNDYSSGNSAWSQRASNAGSAVYNAGAAVGSYLAPSNYIVQKDASIMNTDESGDEMRLLEALGEDPREYMKLFGINNALGRWNSLARTADKIVNRSWSLKDLLGKTTGEINKEKKERADNAVAEYVATFGDKAFAVFQKDINTLKERIAQSKDQNMQSQFSFLKSSAELAKQELKKKQIDVVFNKVKPSENDRLLKNSLNRLSDIKRTLVKDKDSEDVYEAVLARLQEIQRKINVLRENNEVSAAHALKEARSAQGKLNRNLEEENYELYNQVIAVLEKETGVEKKNDAQVRNIDQRVKDLLNKFKEDANNAPQYALEESMNELEILKKDLERMERQKVNNDAIRRKKHAISAEEEVINHLEDKVREAESDERTIARKVDELLKKHDDDKNAAKEELTAKINKMRSGAHKIDKGMLELLDKKIKEDELLETKHTDLQNELDVFMADKVKFDAKTQDPNDAIKKLKEGLLKVQRSLKDKKSKNNKMYAVEIKKLQKEITLYEMAIEKIEQESSSDFDTQVEEKMKSVLKHNNNDDKKALKTLIATGGSTSSYSLSDWFSGKSAVSTETMIDRIPNHIDKAVAKKLDARITKASENNSVNMAMARMKSASAFDMPEAIQDVVVAKLGQLGFSMDKLDMQTREQLANDTRDVSGQLANVINNPRLSESQKQQQKQTIMNDLVERLGYGFASGKLGIDAAALQSKDLSVIATSKLVNSLTGSNDASLGSSRSSNNVRNSSSYGSGAMVPYSGSRNASNVQYSNSRALTTQGSRNVGYANSYDMGSSYSQNEERNNALQFLGLDASASQADIRKRYLELARQYHPDQDGGDKELFQQIHDAYELARG